MSDLYDSDIVEWSERQVALLRRRAAGELVNDAELDWANLAEEIEDVGSNRFSAVQSHIVQALLHDLKCTAWPESRDVPHWRAEARGQRDDARALFTASMRRKIDMAALYRRALRRLPETSDGVMPQPVPDTCPVPLDELLGEP